MFHFFDGCFPFAVFLSTLYNRKNITTLYFYLIYTLKKLMLRFSAIQVSDTTIDAMKIFRRLNKFHTFCFEFLIAFLIKYKIVRTFTGGFLFLFVKFMEYIQGKYFSGEVSFIKFVAINGFV